jgi:SAM-dependent methyltransferase
MESLQKSKKGYKTWHKKREDDAFMEEKEYYKLIGTLLKGKKTVDIGCGYGSIEVFSPETVGVDFSEEALKIAKQRGAKNLIKAPAENLPFEDNEFEIAVSIGTLEHVADIKQAISEMVRVSEIQILVVHAALPYGIEFIRKPLMKLFGLKDQPIENPQKLSDLKEMLKNNGSRVLIEGAWNYIDLRWISKQIPYGLVKWPSHHFLMAIKTPNLERRFLGELNMSTGQS